MRHLMEPEDFSMEETAAVLDLADRIAVNPEAYAHVADGKKLATLFYEPSTRTRLSFESAMLNLGGKTLGFSGAEQSSATKGESVSDTARVVSCYADIIAMRHPKEGAPLRASMYAKVPVINAGDGGHNHPTQTMIDLMTIRQRLGRLDHLTVGLRGFEIWPHGSLFGKQSGALSGKPVLFHLSGGVAYPILSEGRRAVPDEHAL